MHVLAELGAPGDEVRRVVRGLTSRYVPTGWTRTTPRRCKLLGIDLDDVIGRIDRDLGAGDGAIPRRATSGSPATCKKALELSLREALRLGDGFIGTEHVLLGLILRQGDQRRHRDARGLRPHRRRRTARGRRGGSPHRLTGSRLLPDRLGSEVRAGWCATFARPDSACPVEAERGLVVRFRQFAARSPEGRCRMPLVWCRIGEESSTFSGD